MNLTEIVNKTLGDELLKTKLSSTLQAMGGTGSHRKVDVEEALSEMVREIATIHLDRPLSKARPAWKAECTSDVNNYLGTNDVSAHINKVREHLRRAHSVEKSKLHLLD